MIFYKTNVYKTMCTTSTKSSEEKHTNSMLMEIIGKFKRIKNGKICNKISYCN